MSDITRPRQLRMPPPNPRQEAAKPPPVPAAFMSEEAEAEIRRNVTRHYQQVSDIAQLKNDVDHWKHRAELAEAEVQNLGVKLMKLEEARDNDNVMHVEEVDRLKEVINTLHVQFENGARIWLASYDVLKQLRPTLVTPHQLIEQKTEEDPK
jgi:predicted  nucleic acid-binding Zn-ribbon protein